MASNLSSSVIFDQVDRYREENNNLMLQAYRDAANLELQRRAQQDANFARLLQLAQFAQTQRKLEYEMKQNAGFAEMLSNPRLWETLAGIKLTEPEIENIRRATPEGTLRVLELAANLFSQKLRYKEEWGMRIWEKQNQGISDALAILRLMHKELGWGFPLAVMMVKGQDVSRKIQTAPLSTSEAEALGAIIGTMKDNPNYIDELLSPTMATRAEFPYQPLDYKDQETFSNYIKKIEMEIERLKSIAHTDPTAEMKIEYLSNLRKRYQEEYGMAQLQAMQQAAPQEAQPQQPAPHRRRLTIAPFLARTLLASGLGQAAGGAPLGLAAGAVQLMRETRAAGQKQRQKQESERLAEEYERVVRAFDELSPGEVPQTIEEYEKLLDSMATRLNIPKNRVHMYVQRRLQELEQR